MSSNSNEKSSHEMDQLHERAQNLRHLLSHQLERARRKHRGILVAGVILMIATIASLGNLTRLTFALDAQTLTELGRSQVEQSLPAGRVSMEKYLRGEAPRIAQGVIASLVGSIPSLRSLVLQQFSERLQQLTIDLELRLSNEMRQAIQNSRSQIDVEFPNDSEMEKISRLMAIVAERFEANAESAFLALYPDYSHEMEKVFQYLEDLRTKPEQSLTPKERLQKEIIQTTLRITLHAHESQKNGGVDF